MTRDRPRLERLAWAAVLAAVVAGGAARFVGVGWGMPCVFHVDEHGFVMAEAVGTEWRGVVRGDYRPVATVYGPLVYDLAIAVKWAMYGGPDTVRPRASAFPSEHAYYMASFDAADPEAPYSLADWTRAMRAISALLGTLSVLVMALAAWRLGGTWAGIAAAWLTALAPGLVQVSHFYTSDALLVFEIALVLHAAARLARGGGAWNGVYAGLALGLVAATKMPGMLLGLVVAAAIAWSPRAPRTGALRLGSPLRRSALGRWIGAGLTLRMGACVGAMLAVFLAFHPWLVDGRGALASGGNRSGLWMLATYFREREFGFYDWRFTYNDAPPFLFWLTDVLPYALGVPALAAAGLGLGRALTRGGHGPRLALVAALPSYLLVGAWGVMSVRHVLPAVPGLVLAGALVFGDALARGGARRALALAALVWLGAYGTAWAGMFRHEDPRLTASRVVAARAAGEVVVLDPEAHYTAPLGTNDELVGVPPWVARRGGAARAPTLRYLWASTPAPAAVAAHLDQLLGDARFLVVGDFYRRRGLHRSAPARAREQAVFYRALFAGGTGFHEIARLALVPSLGPLVWDESGAETLFVDFDHMPVWVFERRGAFVNPLTARALTPPAPR